MINRIIDFTYYAFLKVGVKLKNEEGTNFITWYNEANYAEPKHLPDNVGQIIEKYGVFK